MASFVDRIGGGNLIFSCAILTTIGIILNMTILNGQINMFSYWTCFNYWFILAFRR